jgi:hypothetical protein
MKSSKDFKLFTAGIFYLLGGDCMGRRHKGSLAYQMNSFFNSILALGKSKHEAKERFREIMESQGKRANPSQSFWIHSLGTAKTYRQWSQDFTEYIKATTDIKDRDEITREHLQRYVEDKKEHYEETKGHARPHTMATICSSLNKIFSDREWEPLTKKEFGVENKSYKTVKRSRDSQEQRIPEKWNEAVEVSRSFGLRREGLEQIKASNIYRDDQSGSLKVRVVEKGGRYREAECIRAREDVVEQIMTARGYQIPTEGEMTKVEYKQAYKTDQSEKLYDGISRNIDIHHFRREYAQAKYGEVVERMQEQENELTPIYNGTYYEEALREVSENLGHSRVSVVVYSYLK